MIGDKRQDFGLLGTDNESSTSVYAVDSVCVKAALRAVAEWAGISASSAY